MTFALQNKKIILKWEPANEDSRIFIFFQNIYIFSIIYGPQFDKNIELYVLHIFVIVVILSF